MKPSLLLLCILALCAAWSAGAEEGANAREEVAELRQEIARHDGLYHRQAAPEISDFEYDRLKRRLAELERTLPEVERGGGVAMEIGDDRSGLFPTQRHRERMLSLEKAYSAEELRAFDTRLVKLFGREDLAYVVEPKFDGVAVSVTYENGQLVRAVTRGNGTEGDDITPNVQRISGLPVRLRTGDTLSRETAFPAAIEVRGEIYVPFAEFARLNAEREMAGDPPFANPRNLAAGTIRQRDAGEVAGRGLRVVFYGIGACEPATMLPATQRELHARLKEWGLPGVEEFRVVRGGDELVRAIEALRRARTKFAFPTDGAVAKLDSIALQRDAGEGESAPRWAIAYKFAPERAETQVRAITIQVGRTGVLTPVAELAPVNLAGSTIARATLHNRIEIARKDIRVGDFVVVEKAGEIVPAIVEVDRARRAESSAAFVFPTRCPSCAELVVAEGGGTAVRCGNRVCPAQVQRRIEHFASRASMDIPGLGPATVETLVGCGLVKRPADLYRLTREDLVTRAKLGPKVADRLLTGIAASKSAELRCIVHALGIPGVGPVAAREVADRCATLADLPLLDASDAPSRAVVAFFEDAENRAVLSELIESGVGAGGK